VELSIAMAGMNHKKHILQLLVESNLQPLEAKFCLLTSYPNKSSVNNAKQVNACIEVSLE